MRYTKYDVGCWADGSLGHGHIREKLKDMIRSHPALTEPYEELMMSLEGEMPDDAWDEDKALELLNKQCDPDVTFVFSDGDLLLVPYDEVENY